MVNTSIKAINSDRVVEKGIPIVNLKLISEIATEFELGFTQVEQTQPLERYWQALFSSDTSEETKALLKRHNTHLNNPVITSYSIHYTKLYEFGQRFWNVSVATCFQRLFLIPGEGEKLSISLDTSQAFVFPRKGIK